MKRPARLPPILALLPLLLAGCAQTNPLSLVREPDSGLMYGAQTSRIIVMDPSQLRDRRLKLVVRNVTGDPAFDLHGFTDQLTKAYMAKGFEPAEGEEFGLLLDMAVVYSGQLTQRRALELGLIGGAAGLTAGTASLDPAAPVAGATIGATAGAILGSYLTDETYAVAVEVTGAVPARRAGRTDQLVVFDRSREREEWWEERRRNEFRQFERTAKGMISVYGAGRGIHQRAVAEELRIRLLRILSDIL